MRQETHLHLITGAFKWLVGVASTVTAGGVIWLIAGQVQVQQDVAVLKDRPPSVTKEEFNYAMQAIDQRFKALEDKKP